MLYLGLQLLLMLFIILIASELFTNALEHLGYHLGLSTGVIGSIFAAIATALPETMVPVIAIFAGTSDARLNQDISVGAILGAPLMLSTLTVFLVSLFAIKRRGLRGRLTPEITGLLRDLHFFIVAFCLAALALYLPVHPWYLRFLIGLMLMGLYVVYLILTFKASHQLVAEGHGIRLEESLFFTRLHFKNAKTTILMQMSLGLFLLIGGAKGFIAGVEQVTHAYHVSALAIALFIIPVATELPEKVNSILWIRKRKDTLAFSNITGAMVFQGSLLPALGVALRSWQPSSEVLSVILITLIAALWLRLNVSKRGFYIPLLFVNGMLYWAYIFWVLWL